MEVYAEAADLLEGWQMGITLDEQGIAVLEHCLSLLGQNAAMTQLLEAARVQPA